MSESPDRAEPRVALEAPLEDDLSPITERLWAARVPHRVTSDEHGQYLLVLDDVAVAEVARIREALTMGTAPPAPRTRFDAGVARWLARAPFTTCVVVLSLLVAPLSLAGDASGWLGHLFVVPPEWNGDGAVWHELLAVLLAGEPWRLLTPCLLHFTLVHLAMDVVLFAEFGRRIERGVGSLAAIVAFVGIGVFSNVVQFVVGGSGLFGGLSGVVMGQLGFLLMAARKTHRPILRVPPSLAIGILVTSALFATGITEWVGLHIANAAHWSGFAAGILLAAAWRMRRGESGPRSRPSAANGAPTRSGNGAPS